MNPSQFERLIEHLHLLLEREGAQVLWNPHIPDPDNPAQPRQIDVVIQRDGLTTHVECRFRKERQDVTWIEELIGRRASLRADCVMAVSASGFTEGAVRKAEVHGITLHDLKDLSRNDVLNWGKRLTLTVKWLHMDPLSVCLLIAPEDEDRVTPGQVTDALHAPGALYSILERIKGALPEDKLREGGTVAFHDSLDIKLIAGSCLIRRAEVTLTAWLTEEPFSFASVAAYGEASQELNEREVHIGDASPLGIRIGRCADKFSILFAKMMSQPPTHAMFYRLLLDFDTPVAPRCIQSLNEEMLPELCFSRLSLSARLDEYARA